jgi:hypothetical protein
MLEALASRDGAIAFVARVKPKLPGAYFTIEVDGKSNNYRVAKTNLFSRVSFGTNGFSVVWSPKGDASWCMTLPSNG